MTVEHSTPSELGPVINGIAANHPARQEAGTIVLRVQDAEFKVSPGLLARQSPVFSNAVGPDFGSLDTPYALIPTSEAQHHVGNGQGAQIIRTVQQVTSEDFEVLLQAFLDEAEPSTFDRAVSLIRICSPQQLDIGTLYAKAREAFALALPAEPLVLKPNTHPLYVGLDIAERYGFPKIRNAILYTLVTTHHFVDEEEGADTEALKPEANDLLPLSDSDRALCTHIMHTLIAHFTPTLYTVASAGHMGCTDALAEHWMNLVILPSYSDDGVYKPIETLERIKQIEWEKWGLCKECCEEKRKEWTEEQALVWEKLGDWVSEAENAGKKKGDVV